MKKKKTTSIARPFWYPLDIYNKNLSATELLDEICKRDILHNHLKSQISQEQKEASFLRIIIQNKIIPASSQLKKTSTRAIKPISVFEVFNMEIQISNSKWYQTLDDKNELEEVRHAYENGQPLNNTQIKILEKYLDIPWHKFQANLDDNKEYPLNYSYGIPVTIDIGIDKSIAIKELENLFTKMRGGKKIWALSPEIFESWKRKNIFAIFDLQKWFEIKGIKYKKTDLGRIIWGSKPPNSPILEDSTVDMKAFINESIKESQKVIQKGTIRPLWLYCEDEIQRATS